MDAAKSEFLAKLTECVESRHNWLGCKFPPILAEIVALPIETRREFLREIPRTKQEAAFFLDAFCSGGPGHQITQAMTFEQCLAIHSKQYCGAPWTISRAILDDPTHAQIFLQNAINQRMWFVAEVILSGAAPGIIDMSCIDQSELHRHVAEEKYTTSREVLDCIRWREIRERALPQ